MRFFGLVLIALLLPALARADCDTRVRTTVPLDVIGHKRTLVQGTPSAGGYLVGTQTMGDQFIDVLRPRSLC